MRTAGWLLAGALLVTAGCGGGEAGDKTPIQLVVADKNIRAEGAECAGALPFQYVHAEAPYSIENANGDVVADGELPAGRARNAEPEVDWEVERIPTYCVFDLDVELTDAARYQLRLERGSPLAFTVDPKAVGKPVVLVLG